MPMWMSKEALDAESEIVWKENIDCLDYVRESVLRRNRRRGPIACPWSGRIVGYAELAKNKGGPGGFFRRVFWLKPHDRDSDPDGVYATGCPMEAVDPQTLAPGWAGRLTDRAWGGEMPKPVWPRIAERAK
ncbi:MAG: DUF6009 family protein [Planctomycetota bacterium]|jgi:hypothetical protein